MLHLISCAYIVGTISFRQILHTSSIILVRDKRWHTQVKNMCVIILIMLLLRCIQFQWDNSFSVVENKHTKFRLCFQFLVYFLTWKAINSDREECVECVEYLRLPTSKSKEVYQKITPADWCFIWIVKGLGLHFYKITSVLNSHFLMTVQLGSLLQLVF